MSSMNLLAKIRAAAKRLGDKVGPAIARGPLGALNAGTQSNVVKPRGGNWAEFDEWNTIKENTPDGKPYDLHVGRRSGLMQNLADIQDTHADRIGNPDTTKALQGFTNKQLKKYLQTRWGTADDPVADMLAANAAPSEFMGGDDTVADWLETYHRSRGRMLRMHPELPEDPRDIFTGATMRRDKPEILARDLTDDLHEYHGFDDAMSMPSDVAEQSLRLPAWAKLNEQYYDMDAGPDSFSNIMGAQLQPVYDYLATLRPDQIERMSVPDAFRNAKAWHDELSKKMSDKTIESGGVTPIMELDNGYRWVELSSDDALNAEGKMMGHCVGSYCDQVKAGGTRILSLRDKQGKPHATVEVRPSPHGTSEDGLSYTDEAIRDLDEITKKYWFDDETPSNGHEFPHKTMEAHALNALRALKADALDGLHTKPGGITDPRGLIDALTEWRKKHPSKHPGEVHQAKGKQNAAPVAEYVPMVQQLLNQRFGSLPLENDYTMRYRSTAHDIERMGLHPVEHGGRRWYGTEEQWKPYMQGHDDVILPDDFQGFAKGGEVTKKREKLPHETLGYRLKQLNAAKRKMFDAISTDSDKDFHAAVRRWPAQFMDEIGSLGEWAAKKKLGEDDFTRVMTGQGHLPSGLQEMTEGSEDSGGRFMGEMVNPAYFYWPFGKQGKVTKALEDVAVRKLKPLAHALVPQLDSVGGLGSVSNVVKPKGGNWMDYTHWDSANEAPKLNVNPLDRSISSTFDRLSGQYEAGSSGRTDVARDVIESSVFGKYLKGNLRNYLTKNWGSPDDPLAWEILKGIKEGHIGWGGYMPVETAEYQAQWLKNQQNAVKGPIDPRDMLTEGIQKLYKHPKSGLMLSATKNNSDTGLSGYSTEPSPWVRERLAPDAEAYQVPADYLQRTFNQRGEGYGAEKSPLEQLRFHLSGANSQDMPLFQEAAKTDPEISNFLKQHYKRPSLGWDKVKNMSAQDVFKDMFHRKNLEDSLRRRKVVELGHGRVEREYPDKMRWIELLEQPALTDEGKMMSHCVGGSGYCKRIKQGLSSVFSLRDPKTGRSHATFEVGHQRPSLPKFLRDNEELYTELGARDRYELDSALKKRAKEAGMNERARENLAYALDDPMYLDDMGDYNTYEKLFKALGLGKYYDQFTKQPGQASVKQMKWNRNQTVPEQYQPYIQDLLSNPPKNIGEWNSISDWGSAGLQQIGDKFYRAGNLKGFRYRVPRYDEHGNPLRDPKTRQYLNEYVDITPENKKKYDMYDVDRYIRDAIINSKVIDLPLEERAAAMTRTFEQGGYGDLLQFDPAAFETPVEVKLPYKGSPRGFAKGGVVKSNPLRDELSSTLREVEKHHKLPAKIMDYLAEVESNWNPKAVSKKGAKGLFQLMPITQKELGVNDPHDPYESAWAAGRYLAKQIQQFKSIDQALGAYNWGPGNMKKHGMAKAPAETQNYVGRLTAMLDSLVIPEPAKGVIKAQQQMPAPTTMGTPALPSAAVEDPINDPEVRALLSQLLESNEQEEVI